LSTVASHLSASSIIYYYKHADSGVINIRKKNVKICILLCVYSSFIFTGLLSFPAANAQTAFQLVQSPANNRSSGYGLSTSLTLSANPTSGNMLILTVGIDGVQNFTTVSSITQSGVTWTKVCNSSYNGGTTYASFDTEIWAGTVGSGASKTVSITFSKSSCNWLFQIGEWSGIWTSNFLDRTASSQNSYPGSTTPSTGTTSTTQHSNELCIGSTFLTYYDQSSPTNGYTIVDYYDLSVSHDSLAYLYKTAAITGQQSCNTTGSNSNCWFGCIATFVSVDANPTPTPSLTPTPTPPPNHTPPPSQNTPTAAPTNMPSTTPTPSPTPPPPPFSSTITLSCQSTTTSSGFKVEINGNLKSYGVAMPNSRILISYSSSGGFSWQSLTSVVTGSDGSFSAEWLPTVSGNYYIMASFDGDWSHASASSIVNLNVDPSSSQIAQNLFSVASNSTVTGLVFDSNSGQLSFTVNGTSHTVGYVDVCIAKSLIHDMSLVKVYVDGNSVNFATSSSGDSWILHFVYYHSTHAVTLDLNQTETSGLDLTPVAVIVVSLVAAGLIIFALRRRN
jgi:hypothetical protein